MAVPSWPFWIFSVATQPVAAWYSGEADQPVVIAEVLVLAGRFVEQVGVLFVVAGDGRRLRPEY